MKEINFYNNSGNLIMRFSNFRFDNSLSNTVIVRSNGKINAQFFYLETDFDAEVLDFNEFLLSLQLMNAKKRKFANFNPILSTIAIQFIMQDYCFCVNF
jgi:hypothetical protein